MRLGSIILWRNTCDGGGEEKKQAGNQFNKFPKLLNLQLAKSCIRKK